MSKHLLHPNARHPWSFFALADRAYTSLRELSFSYANASFARIAEAAVVATMQNITYGHLRVLTYSRIYTFPAPAPTPAPAPASAQNKSEEFINDGPRAELRVVDDIFWIRLFAMGDLGFSEAYMFGNVECDDLVALFQIFLLNRKNLTEMNSSISPWLSLPSRLTSSRFVNSLANSRSNISAHYDISNAMFEAFLSEDMTYSCAIFNDLDGDKKRGIHDPTGSEALSRFGSSAPTAETVLGFTHEVSSDKVIDADASDELQEAQMRKLRHILRKADIRRGHRVLEIGSGWGSFAILAAQETGCQIDTITLSVQQQSLAHQRISDLGLSHQIRVHLKDYRTLPSEWKHSFDRVVSIEMVEAVGREYLSQYFSIIDWALKPEEGVGVIQAITIPEARFERYVREVDFIQKWIFPGGFIPTVTLLLESMQKGSQGRLVCDAITNIGPHYARTLREWRRRFQASWECVIAPALIAEHPETLSGSKGKNELQVFKRKWLYYYCYCEIGFANRILGDHILSFTREGASGYGHVPFD